MKSLFYKPIKLKTDPENILFWGCVHNGHRCERWETPLWKLRGHNSMEEHDNANISNWNAKANENTIGVLLGDTLFGGGGRDRFINFCNSLTFRHLHIMPGNHYSSWQQAFELADQNILQLGEKTVIFVPNYLEFIINGQSIVTSHFPVLSWNGQGGGSWMLYSHVHGKLENSEVGRLYSSQGKSLEVSVEKFKSPPTFGEIKEILDNRPMVSYDGHGAHTQNPF